MRTIFRILSCAVLCGAATGAALAPVGAPAPASGIDLARASAEIPRADSGKVAVGHGEDREAGHSTGLGPDVRLSIAEVPLPDPQSWGAMAWLLAGLIALVGVAGMILAAINGALALRDKLRGRPEPQPQIIAQPITVKTEVEFLPVPQFKEFEDYVHKRNHELRNEVNQVALQLEHRRIETADQLDSLRDKLDGRFNEAITANNSSASKTHMRIDHLAENVGVLTGEVKHIAAAARDAALAAQAAAVEAAKAGGRKS